MNLHEANSAVIDWRSISLLGIDVGFSKTAKTTGIAVYERGQLIPPVCIGSSPQDRAAVLRSHMTFDAIAIDGPIVADAGSVAARHCEHVLARGVFGKRCKAGFSHFGTGLQLRQAATTIAAEMPAHRRTATAPIVEAFPNAFLGVLLDDDDYTAFGPIKRGEKSDVFYRRVAANGAFETLLQHLGWTDDALLKTLHDNAHATTRAAHEHRAALVCLLTAACALSGKATSIGDEAGGHICLPPIDICAPWARAALRP